MLDVMYEIPSEKSVTGCVMTKEAVDGTERPKLIRTDDAQTKEKKQRGRKKNSLEETA